MESPIALYYALLLCIVLVLVAPFVLMLACLCYMLYRLSRNL